MKKERKIDDIHQESNDDDENDNNNLPTTEYLSSRVWLKNAFQIQNDTFDNIISSR